MKAILVIDMPNRCFNCPLHETLDAEEGEHEFMVFCSAEHWREPITHTPVENLEERPSWCPLRPIIDDIPEDESAVYVRGFLDGILNIVDDDEEEAE